MLHRAGFSLIEVALSLGLVTTALLTVAMMLPPAMKTQQIVRMQAVAAARAISVSETIAQGNPRFPGFAPSTPNVGDSWNHLDLSYANMMTKGGAYSRPSFPDAEQMIAGCGRAFMSTQTGIPLPLNIAQRLDSDNDEIRSILDQGGMIFFPPPGSISGMAASEYKFAERLESSTDQERLIFAVKGFPQQNLMPVHPCYNLPIYKLYPFPPDSFLNIQFTYYGIGTGAGGKHTNPYILSPLHAVNPERVVSAGSTGTIKAIWQYFNEIKAKAAANDFDKAWLGIWAGSYADYLSLCRYGWTPIACKLSNAQGTKVLKHALDWPKDGAGNDFNHDWYWGNVFSPSLTVPNKGYGSVITSDGSNGSVFINTYPEKYYAYPPVELLDPADPGTATPDAWWRLIAPFDPVDLPPYNTTPFKKGDGVNTERYREPAGLPTLEMRRYYRRLALQLWMKTLDPSSDAAASHTPWQPGDDSNAFEKLVPAAKNPLISLISPKVDISTSSISSTGDLCTGENWRYPHPARIYALTFLAHAAMMVTGARGPLIATKGGLGYGRYVPNGTASLQDKPPGMYDVFPTDIWGLGASTAAWLLCDMNQDHPGLTNSASSSVFDDPGAALANTNRKYYDGFQLLNEDIEFARMAHENCMRWISVYASENPNDLCCPRPANRQSFMDRPLWAFDLFPGGAANRGTAPFQYYNYLEEYYRLYSDRPTIFSPIFSGKQKYVNTHAPSWDGFERLINPN